jgi:Zn-dependent protease
MNTEFIQLLLLAPPILFALSFHEFSHGYVANQFGDPTAKMLGRLSMNPLRHLDPFGTLMIFLVHFGWAKPVPVNIYNLRNPRQDMLWIALAGPASNMLLALITGILIRLIGPENMQVYQLDLAGLLKLMLIFNLKINLALAVFNLLPIPPLDGGRILRGLTPPQYDHIVDKIESVGPMALMGLIIFGMVTKISIFGFIIWPFVNFFSTLFAGATF